MKKYHQRRFIRLSATLAGVLAIVGAQAQTAQSPTDAGQTLKQLQSAPRPLPAGKALALPSDIKAKVARDGRSVSLSGVAFHGNQHVGDADLHQVLGGNTAWSKPLSLEALRDLVDTITDHYRARGYPFARAFLLPGSLNDQGLLTIQIVEGQYAKVQATSADPDLVGDVEPFLRPLAIGDVVEAGPLERVTLLVDDLPGYTATPVMRPGAEVGTGELNVVMEQEPRVDGRFGINNHGNVYAGELRPLGVVSVNRLIVFGDELSVSAMSPVSGNWMASGRYAVPLGAHGARIHVGMAKTAYSLSGDFEGFRGSATEKTVGVSYPIVRSRLTNLAVSLSYKDKTLRDEKLGQGERKDVWATPLIFSFDRRDGLGRGGMTYGALTFTAGELTSEGLRSNFSHWQWDVARLQRLSEDWHAFAHLVVQGTSDNLDSSEGFSLGGANAVRAYPAGEASGDDGWLIQLEARTTLGDVEPYLFYDHGVVRVDGNPAQVLMPSPDLTRAGVGVGMRVNKGNLSLDAALAWRTKGGAPSAEAGEDPKPRWWFSISHRF